MSIRLRDAVENLTEETPVVIRHDDGTMTAGRRPVRLAQLDEAISSTMGSSGGSAGLPSERNVLGADALYRSVRIMTTIGDWCRMIRVPVTRDAITDLTAWHAGWESTTRTPEATNWHTDQLTQWAEEIDAMFNRPRPLDITTPCPVCKAEKYTTDDGDVGSWPLKGSTDPLRVECKACTTTWEGEDAAKELAEEISVSPPTP